MCARKVLIFVKRSNIKFAIIIVTVVLIFNRLLYYMDAKNNIRPLMIENVKAERTRKILLWNSFFGVKDYGFGIGNDPFFTSNCSVLDCYISIDRNWIPVEYYDAIVFHGPQYEIESLTDYPTKRNPFQWYAFLTMESPTTNPLYQYSEGYFNLTMTYRIDSDINLYYVNFYTIDGVHVAPSLDPKWIRREIKNETRISYMKLHEQKTKPVAWFVSRCTSPNSREILVNKLSKMVQVDIYGCGPFSCPRSESKRCRQVIRTDYYFYLAFENSNCVDYVTEKVATAFENDAIPIVYGGANYTRFFPPHSYIDASQLTVEQISDKLKYLMDNPEEYAGYFWWRDYYKIAEPRSMFCDLCEFLHKDLPPKVYHLRDWWHGNADKPMCTDRN